ncbi:hypothetical protein [Sulfurospirillum sp. 1612]|uniref:hypothetical protein n=1 Tax=Sulfurospirillum sp. 1612 TaxID=3094835 RepID=UPI002F937F5D
MEELVPEFIEPTPIIKGKKCRVLLYLLYYFMTYTPLLCALVIGYYYDFLFAIAAFLFGTLAMSVLISKMRLVSLPPSQREMSYTNREIARWYLGKNICFDDETKEL